MGCVSVSTLRIGQAIREGAKLVADCENNYSRGGGRWKNWGCDDKTSKWGGVDVESRSRREAARRKGLVDA